MNYKKTLLNFLLVPLLAIATATPVFSDDNIEGETTNPTALEQTVQNEIPKTPKFNLRPYRCANYATQAAEKLYRKHYTPANAWNLRDNNNILFPINSYEELETLAKDKIIQPGMIIGTYNPSSSRNKKNRLYTHVVLYIGINKQGEPEFVHQWGSKIKQWTLSELKAKKLKPIEVIDEN